MPISPFCNVTIRGCGLALRDCSLKTFEKTRRQSTSPNCRRAAIRRRTSDNACIVETVRDQLATHDGNRALFLTIHGKSIAPNTLTEYGRRYLSSAGIDKPGACHIYRHSMATQMHENGADLTLIQQIFGHAKSDTTQIYARTSLRRLLAIHDTTHPASQPESDGENSPQ